ncbi:antirepressor [Bifidobacteriaceae bacterium MCC01998]|jgi:anti-repressor protein|nr:antirepressor [Bifidobacteriaceae bacterium MCC02037]GDZ67218.1 antirepressor [Bifidobacteriaceae bacterium MCC01988]GDZ74324.1 antirepressor [Bifidobacteriaceae bacterium MCC01998]DAZ43428.1 MAG TPA: repressor domain protein [Caudoviricetes sp.]
MSNEIQRFEFKGAALRTLTDENGEPWFVAKDVCDVLELSNVGQALARLDDDEKSSITLNDGTPGNPNKAIVSESGLYALVLASRKPEAHEFKRWVTHEVLPQIRKTGGYIPTTDVDDDMTILAKAVMIGQRTMEEQKRRIAEQSEHIKVLEPKARFADAVAASDGTCLIGELAKMLRQNGLDIGQNRLFEILRQDGYLGKTGSNRNVPTQKAMDLGLFRIKETAITHSDGHVTINRTAKVTGKGQTYFISRYCPPADDE